MPIVKINNIHFYYEITGSGKPFVLILGTSTDVSEWQWLTKELSKKYKVIAFDNRGTGRTDKPRGPYTVAQLAADTNLLMEKLEVKQATIMGISLGGRVAMELALDFPDKVSELILVSTSAKGTKSLRFGVLNAISFLPFLKGKYPQPYYARNAQRQASLNYDNSSRLGDLALPTHILHGENDKLVKLNYAKDLKRLIKKSDLKTFKGGHLFMLFKSRQEFIDYLLGP